MANLRSANSACFILMVPVVVIAYFFLAPGFVRRIEPVAEPITVGNVTLQLVMADFEETHGLWPISSTIAYRPFGRISGLILNASTSLRNARYRITITSSDGVTRVSRCYVGSTDACDFQADLARADLNKGIKLTVVNDRDGRVVIPPRLVIFTHTVSYSLARWDAMMTV